MSGIKSYGDFKKNVTFDIITRLRFYVNAKKIRLNSIFLVDRVKIQ